MVVALLILNAIIFQFLCGPFLNFKAAAHRLVLQNKTFSFFNLLLCQLCYTFVAKHPLCKVLKIMHCSFQLYHEYFFFHATYVRLNVLLLLLLLFIIVCLFISFFWLWQSRNFCFDCNRLRKQHIAYYDQKQGK